MIREKCRSENVAEILFGRIFDHFDLLDYHAALAFKLLFIEPRIEQHVRDQLKRLFEPIIDNLYRKSRFLVRRERVKIAAEPILLDRDLQSRALGCALKYCVFNKMRDSVKLRRLMPRSAIEEKPQRR